MPFPDLQFSLMSLSSMVDGGGRALLVCSFSGSWGDWGLAWGCTRMVPRFDVLPRGTFGVQCWRGRGDACDGVGTVDLWCNHVHHRCNHVHHRCYCGPAVT